MSTGPSNLKAMSMPTGNSTEEAHACLRHVWSYGCHGGCLEVQQPYVGLYLAYCQAESLLLSLLSVWVAALRIAEVRLKSP